MNDLEFRRWIDDHPTFYWYNRPESNLNTIISYSRNQVRSYDIPQLFENIEETNFEVTELILSQNWIKIE